MDDVRGVMGNQIKMGPDKVPLIIFILLQITWEPIEKF